MQKPTTGKGWFDNVDAYRVGATFFVAGATLDHKTWLLFKLIQPRLAILTRLSTSDGDVICD